MSATSFYLFIYFILAQRLLHCSWDMNSAFRPMNSNLRLYSKFFYFFIFFIFSFQ